ncbi:hypothetical protein OEZ85_007480 [Tetradesmus obliquus]|uniref:Protein kinase domain-containing protein n=1 Tax=Tetradesmus obliquus TaxID=3088 RepID=A0ABY8TGC9_TETOB|nr:hypothetical protein OEZ85_007480 [Tetradesmus obliquus]
MSKGPQGGPGNACRARGLTSRRSRMRRVSRFRHSQQVQRPGIPNPIRLSAFKLADKPSPPLRGDDKEGHYNYELGENISSRYKILSKFGEGTFGRVLECWDRKHKDYVAVKIVRNVDKYRHAAMIELEVLNTLERNDPDAKRHCVKLKEWFQYRGHVCMVFEKLGPSLYDFLRRNEYQPLPLALVQAVARQLLVAVAYMHELGLVHTDLKPENILLAAQDHMKLPAVPPATVERRVPRDSTIKVIDFGSATFEDGYHSSIISTRHYRAPEVILGLGWSFACDLWSCGCILVELAVGDALFQTHENLEHLAMMQQVLGPIPEAMSSKADKHSARYFTTAPTGAAAAAGDPGSSAALAAAVAAAEASAAAAAAAAAGGSLRLAWPEGATRKSLRAVRRLSDLRSLLASHADQAGLPGAGEAMEALAGLIEGLLRYDPATRTTAVEALQHEFFSIHLDMPAAAAVAGGGSAAAAQLVAAGAALDASQLLPALQAAAAAGSWAAASVQQLLQHQQLFQQQQQLQQQQQQQQQQDYAAEEQQEEEEEEEDVEGDEYEDEDEEVEGDAEAGDDEEDVDGDEGEEEEDGDDDLDGGDDVVDEDDADEAEQ